MKRIITLGFSILVSAFLFAREGMWMPQLLSSLNEKEMRSMGMQLSAEDIYSINNTSLKDAVLQFGNGCTGELISPEGLLVTNHHCGFSQIQSLSTLEKNYLDNGFWAHSHAEEIPCPGLSVTFIRQIRDISDEILALCKDHLNEDQRISVLKTVTDSLEKRYTTKEWKALIRPFYAGNKFYLFLVETFSDIRLVGTPEQSIGKFGGETDNWIWPRHTGDFSLFRIYVGKDNKPASYSVENIPYHPPYFFPVNISGVKEGDFVFVYGFPGRTNEYATSSAIQLIEEQTNPVRISIRELRLNIWREAMQGNDTIRLQYASKFSTLENAYKKWKGEMLGFRRFNVLQEKKEKELLLPLKSKELVASLNDSVSGLKGISLANDVFSEAFSALEICAFAGKCKDFVKLLENEKSSKTDLESERNKLKKEAKVFYRNYNASVDKSIFECLFPLADSLLDNEWLPKELISHQGKEKELATQVFEKSAFAYELKWDALMRHDGKNLLRRIKKDPAFQLSLSIAEKQSIVSNAFTVKMKEINRLQRQYISTLLESAPDRISYPDANSTLRISYGRVSSINPRDGIRYNYFTTASGIAEKFATGNPDFIVSRRLLDLIYKRDFGNYGKNGELQTAFISSLHTTGGNSGSPVLNSKGELVGINFDRIWEGVMSDYYFSEDICRNVALDTRYFLFLVDKLYGASHLIREMKVVE